MFYKKKGIPEENELVICTVKKVLPHSVFVSLDEYDNKEAMINIAEVSPGRIRNIRDFVREGKVIICKVLRIHEAKRHIDLSLRRVPLALRKKKEEEYKQEQKSEKLIELFAKNEKLSMADFYNEIGDNILEEYGTLTNFFNTVLTNEKEVSEKFQGKLSKPLIKLIKEKINLPEVVLESVISMKTKEPNGITIIKDTLKKTEEFAKNEKYKVNLRYISAPKYALTVTANSYKEAEKMLQKVADYAVEIAKSNKLESSWQKKS